MRYPGPNRTNVPTSQTVDGESPAAPGDLVSLPQGTTTGPTIYIFAAGLWAEEQPLELTSAHLVGPAERVPLRIVDPSAHASIAQLVSPGVFFVLPVSPLSPGSTHVAAVTLRSKETVITDRWHFRTADRGVRAKPREQPLMEPMERANLGSLQGFKPRVPAWNRDPGVANPGSCLESCVCDRSVTGLFIERGRRV